MDWSYCISFSLERRVDLLAKSLECARMVCKYRLQLGETIGNGRVIGEAKSLATY